MRCPADNVLSIPQEKAGAGALARSPNASRRSTVGYVPFRRLTLRSATGTPQRSGLPLTGVGHGAKMICCSLSVFESNRKQSVNRPRFMALLLALVTLMLYLPVALAQISSFMTMVIMFTRTRWCGRG